MAGTQGVIRAVSAVQLRTALFAVATTTARYMLQYTAAYPGQGPPLGFSYLPCLATWQVGPNSFPEEVPKKDKKIK